MLNPEEPDDDDLTLVDIEVDLAGLGEVQDTDVVASADLPEAQVEAHPESFWAAMFSGNDTDCFQKSYSFYHAASLAAVIDFFESYDENIRAKIGMSPVAIDTFVKIKWRLNYKEALNCVKMYIRRIVFASVVIENKNEEEKSIEALRNFVRGPRRP